MANKLQIKAPTRVKNKAGSFLGRYNELKAKITKIQNNKQGATPTNWTSTSSNPSRSSSTSTADTLSNPPPVDEET
jgi:hypothetical protein